MISEKSGGAPTHHHARIAAESVLSNNLSLDNERDDFLSPTMDLRKMMAIIGAFYWLIMTLFIVPAACVFTLYIVLLPLMFINLRLYNALEHRLCRMVNEHWTSSGQYTGVVIEEFGDDISRVAGKRSLILVNHLGLIDHYILMTAFFDKACITAGRYLWVIFNIWKATPLGAMWTAHGNFFINGGSVYRNQVLGEFRDHLKNLYWKCDFRWIVMYPEGSRLYLVRNSEKKFAEKNNLVPFKHCAHPRTGAASAVLDVAGPADEAGTLARCGEGAPIEYIVDCTLGYPKGKVAGLGEAMLGEWPDNDSRVALHYRIHKVDTSLCDEKNLREWLYKQYAEKDKLLDDFYRNGRFPGKGRLVHYPLWRNVASQFFWMALFYFHYSLWLRYLFLWLSSFIWY